MKSRPTYIIDVAIVNDLHDFVQEQTTRLSTKKKEKSGGTLQNGLMDHLRLFVIFLVDKIEE